MNKDRAQLQRLILAVAQPDVPIARAQALQRQHPLTEKVIVGVVDHGELDKGQVGKDHVKGELLVPDGVQRVPVQCLCLLFGAVARYADQLDLDEGARGLEDVDGAGPVLVAVVGGGGVVVGGQAKPGRGQ